MNNDVCLIVCSVFCEEGKPFTISAKGFGPLFVFFLMCPPNKHLLILELPCVGSYLDQLHSLAGVQCLCKCSSALFDGFNIPFSHEGRCFLS